MWTSGHNMTQRVIDMTPTWEETARMLIALIESGDSKGQEFARTEIIRMGKIIDHYQAQDKAKQG